MKKWILISLIFAFILAVDYETEIQPIFNSKCTSCHSGSDAEEDLSLTSYNNVMNGGESGDVVIPYDHANSLLWQYVNSGYMPPYGSGSSPLTADQINLIAQWINEGALEEEVSDIVGCIDSNAISCDDEIDTLYFPECNTCSDGVPCDNYYNPNATIDNDLCMYNDVPESNEVSIIKNDDTLVIDWSAFNPPVEVSQYVLMRCSDIDGDTPDSDGNLDGYLEYEMCVLITFPIPFYTETQIIDDFSDAENYSLNDIIGLKYTLSVGYPNNNYWGSAFGTYYYEPENLLLGDLNFDGVINIIDVVTLVNAILGATLTLEQQEVADLNGDGVLNVVDIVSIVNIIVG